MATHANDRTKLRFSVFEVDFATSELCKRGVALNLQEKPFQILALLLERPGEVITREELQRRLWPDGTFVDFDKGLNTAMKKLRHALGDSADAPVFVETLPRKGYRFIAPVYSEPRTGTTAFTMDTGVDEVRRNRSDIRVSGPPAEQEAFSASQGTRSPLFIYLLLSIALVTVAAGLGSYWWISRKQAFPLQNMRVTPITRNGKVRQMAISPDGSFVVFALRDGIYQSLWAQDIGTKNEVQLLPSDTVNFAGIAISPDSKFVYFARSETTNPVYSYMCRMPVTGGAVDQLIRDADTPVSFSPDGTQFVYTRGYPIRNMFEVRIANADGSNDHVLQLLSGHQVYDAGPTWSPKNDAIAVPVHTIGQQSFFTLKTISLRDGRTTELLSSQGSIGRPLWLSSGKNLLVAIEDVSSHRGQLWSITYPEGHLSRFTNDLTDYSSSIDLTRDGSKLATIVTNSISNVWIVSADEQWRAFQVTSGEPSLFQVDEFPDGRLLALGEGIWTMNADATNRRLFADIPDAQSIEPCGRSTVVVAKKDGNAMLLRLGPEGTQPTAIASGDLLSPTCSADGKNVYYFNFAAPEKIRRISAEGGRPSEIADVLGITFSGNLTLSPDGSLLAYPYQQYSPPLVALVVISASGGLPLKTFQVPGFVGRLRWSPDGKALQYLLTQNNATNVWQQPLSGGAPKQITKFDVGQIFDFSWSHNGKRMLMARGETTRDVVVIENFQSR